MSSNNEPTATTAMEEGHSGVEVKAPHTANEQSGPANISESNHNSNSSANPKPDPKGAVATNEPYNKHNPISGLVQRFRRQNSSSVGAPHHQPILPARPATKAPKETLKAVYAAGKYKADLTLDVLMVQSFMAGVYIASAAQLYLAVGGGILGGAVFPGGLIAVILTSAELFTGDALIFIASVLGGQVQLRYLLRNWTVSWCCNFLGSLAWAYFLGYLSGAVEDSGAAALSIKIAEKKALQGMERIFLKAMGANFMVCVAVWVGTTAEEVSGKVLGMWFPTSAFIMMGFEHCVANMFMIPMGMMLGANVTVGRMFAAVFMASLGNIVGGGVFVGAVYWYVFETMSSFNGLRGKIRYNMAASWHKSHSIDLRTMGSFRGRGGNHTDGARKDGLPHVMEEDFSFGHHEEENV